MTDQSREDDPPLTLDYWRLNICTAPCDCSIRRGPNTEASRYRTATIASDIRAVDPLLVAAQTLIWTITRRRARLIEPTRRCPRIRDARRVARALTNEPRGMARANGQSSIRCPGRTPMDDLSPADALSSIDLTHHPYLDLFWTSPRTSGRPAATASGHVALARWLLSPADADTIRPRQAAILNWRQWTSGAYSYGSWGAGARCPPG